MDNYLLRLVLNFFKFLASYLYALYNVHWDFHLILVCIRQVMASNAKCDQIVAFKTAGVTNKEIVKYLNVYHKTVYYA